MTTKLTKNQKRRQRLQEKRASDHDDHEFLDILITQNNNKRRASVSSTDSSIVSYASTTTVDTTISEPHQASLSAADNVNVAKFARSLLEPEEEPDSEELDSEDEEKLAAFRLEQSKSGSPLDEYTFHDQLKKEKSKSSRKTNTKERASNVQTEVNGCPFDDYTYSDETAPLLSEEPATVEPTDTNAQLTGTTAEPATSQQSDSKAPVTSASQMLSQDDIIKKAEYMWKTVKDFAQSHPDFKDEPDKHKLDFFRTKMNFATFMEEFPIVSRYMICMGQYKTRAFRRFLDKVKRAKHPPPDQRPKGYMEDQWIRNQADYVQYLWEGYQKRHQNTAERKWVWQQTYNRLKGEFDDFRDMHKDIEDQVKEEKKQLAAQNARELIERIQSGKQQLSKEEENTLLYELENIAFKKMFSNALKELLATTPKTDHTCEGTGTGSEKQQQKITMIETVDVNRMNEIDDRYKSTEFAGMEPISEEDYAEMQAAEEREAAELEAREQHKEIVDERLLATISEQEEM